MTNFNGDRRALSELLPAERKRRSRVLPTSRLRLFPQRPAIFPHTRALADAFAAHVRQGDRARSTLRQAMSGIASCDTRLTEGTAAYRREILRVRRQSTELEPNLAEANAVARSALADPSGPPRRAASSGRCSTPQLRSLNAFPATHGPRQSEAPRSFSSAHSRSNRTTSSPASAPHTICKGLADAEPQILAVSY